MSEKRYDYNEQLNILVLKPGVSARDTERLSLADGCSVVFAGTGNAENETFEISGDLLKAIGNKAQHVEIEKGLTFSYVSPQEGDIWGNLSELRTLRINNNVGVPTNIDGTGAFQNHPTLRGVEMCLTGEGHLSDNFCRGTAVSSFMVYSAEQGREFGLKAGNSVLFGSLLKSEKGISTAEWNKIHGKQICKTHGDNAYVSEVGRVDGVIEEANAALDKAKEALEKSKLATTEQGKLEGEGVFLETLASRPYLAPIFQEAAKRTFEEKEYKDLISRGGELSAKELIDLLPEAKSILNELNGEIKADMLGSYMDKKYCVPLVERVLQGCSTQAQRDFKDAHIEAKFRENAYKAQIERDESFCEDFKKQLNAHQDKLKQILNYNDVVKHSFIATALNEKGQSGALEFVLSKNPTMDSKEYAQALKDISEAVNRNTVINKEEAKRYIRDISDTYGLLYSATKRQQALKKLKETHTKQEGTYIELPSRISAGDNFLSCRKTEMHSSTDPEKRAFKEEVEAYTKKTVNAIYASCVEYKESFWKEGLKNVVGALGGKVGEKTYEDLIKEKDPIAAYNDLVDFDKKVNKSLLETRGIETQIIFKKPEEKKQIRAVYDFVLNTAKNPPKNYWDAEKEMDQQISSIVQAGDIGFEALRKVLPSLDLSPDGHVIDFEQANFMRDTKDIFVLGAGSKLGDNCLCYTNCNGVYVGHTGDEYRHFKSWAENRYLTSKGIVEPEIKKRLGIIMGGDNDKDAVTAGALRDDIKANIINLKNEMKKAPTAQDLAKQPNDRLRPKEDYVQEIQEWEEFLKKYEEYTSDRLVYESNDTEEKWLSHNSYALQDVNERIKQFEDDNSTRKTKDFNTYEDVYSMNRNALSDELKVEYDKLIAERDAILVDPQEVVTGSHFLSEGKEMGNEKTILAGGKINAGADSFSNNPETIELHKNNPETNITEDVRKKNLYDKSDIFRGRCLMAKEMLKSIFDSYRFRYMRLEEACLDIVVNLFKTLFNLTSWAARTLEKEIRQEKTRRGIYNRNVDEAKEILLTCSGKDGTAFLERLTSKTSPISEYNAVLRVVGRLNLDKILSSNGSDGKKLEQLQSQVQKRLINAVNAQERADKLNKRDGLSKAQLLGIYRQIGLWTREKGTIKTSRSLGRAVAMLGRR
jgi:hypothetical protein